MTARARQGAAISRNLDWMHCRAIVGWPCARILAGSQLWDVPGQQQEEHGSIAVAVTFGGSILPFVKTASTFTKSTATRTTVNNAKTTCSA
jgi:hypothetical protein